MSSGWTKNWEGKAGQELEHALAPEVAVGDGLDAPDHGGPVVGGRPAGSEPAAVRGRALGRIEVGFG